MDWKEYKACDKYVFDTEDYTFTLLFAKRSSRLVANLADAKGSSNRRMSTEDFSQWDETTPDPSLFDVATLEEKYGVKCEPESALQHA